MKQKFRVTAHAPLGAKVLALKKFGTPQQISKGVLSVNKVFNSEGEAIQYLKERAEIYLHNSELSEAIADIEMYGSLTFDTITAQIEQTKTIH